jgi:hypothetical protein
LGGPSAHSNDNIYLESYQFSDKLGEAGKLSFCGSVLNKNTLTLDIAKFLQASLECLEAGKFSGNAGWR